MSQHADERLHPAVFIVGGAVALAAAGFLIDVFLISGGSTFEIDGPVSGLTSYSYTLLGGLVGAVLGGFVGFGLI